MDLTVVFHRSGDLDMKRSFDVGAGPSIGIEPVLGELHELVEDGELDEALVKRASWMARWEAILFSEEVHAGWRRHDDAGNMGVITVLCKPAELGRICGAISKGD